MLDIATTVALIAAAGSGVAVFKFWKERGAIEETAMRASTLSERLRDELNQFKIYTEKGFATQSSTEKRFADAVEALSRDVDNMSKDIGRLTQRIDELLTTLLSKIG